LTLDEFQGFLGEVKGQSDRAAALVGAAFLDDRLKSLLASFMVDAAKEVTLLLEPERPLGTFGARVRAAYCLGLVTDDEYHDLRLVQKIRNEFAHRMRPPAFTDQRIGRQCMTLRTQPAELAPESFVMSEFGSHARCRFALAVAILGVRLLVRAAVDMQKEGVRRVVRPSP